MTLKYTKNALREEQAKLNLLLKYVPTLELKKTLLQMVVQEVIKEVDSQKKIVLELDKKMNSCKKLVEDPLDLSKIVSILKIKKGYENFAGVEVPFLEEVVFTLFEYELMSTPFWFDGVVSIFQKVTEEKVKQDLIVEKINLLEKELREVTLRLNLFEKILIPRALKNIKKIKVFLEDQFLASIARAKVAKSKIMVV